MILPPVTFHICENYSILLENEFQLCAQTKLLKPARID